ncbi:hypothetical protein D3C80_971980 [compost metagenome]
MFDGITGHLLALGNDAPVGNQHPRRIDICTEPGGMGRVAGLHGIGADGQRQPLAPERQQIATAARGEHQVFTGVQILLAVQANTAVGAKDQCRQQHLTTAGHAHRCTDHAVHRLFTGKFAQRVQARIVRAQGQVGRGVKFIAGQRQFREQQKLHALFSGQLHHLQMTLHIAGNVPGNGNGLSASDSHCHAFILKEGLFNP